jgi:Mn2+/Fe2+ NRAMP family transporter
MCDTFVKNNLLLQYYSLDMTNTVFPTFQTPYILYFSLASRSGKNVNILPFAQAHGAFLYIIFTILNGYFVMKEKLIKEVVNNLLHAGRKSKG